MKTEPQRIEVSACFAVPMASTSWSSAAAVNPLLRRLFLEREAQGAIHANPKPLVTAREGLFESRFDLFKWPESCVKELREFCWSSLYRLIAQLNGHDAATMGRLKGHADAWFHITRRGGYFGLHNHPMASWSGVYCVDDGGEGSGDSGLLSFPHPQPAANSYIDMAVFGLRAPFGYGPSQYRLKAGQLLLFPSWLAHQVLPHQGEGERITVAFNSWFRME